MLYWKNWTILMKYISKYFSKRSVNGELLLLLRWHHSRLLVLTHPLLKKVCFALHRYHLHPIKGVSTIVPFLGTQGHQQPVCHALNVLCHQLWVYADQIRGQGLTDEFLLNFDSFTDDFLDPFFLQFVLHEVVEKAGKVSVQSLIPRN